MVKKILLVDDSKIISFTVEKGLKELTDDYEIVSVESGNQCLKYLEENPNPDLILLDIMMPGMSGWDVFDKIKENQTWKDIPIVFLTARVDSVAKTAGSSIGDDYIEKPFEIGYLKERIDKILHN